MKKIAAMILVFTMICSLAACGKDDAKSQSSSQSQVSSGESSIPSAKYYQLLENDDSKYYYEANVVEEFIEDEVTETGLKGEARDGKGNYVFLSGEEKLDIRDIETKNAFYSVYDSDKEYSREASDAPAEGEAGAEDEMKLTYVKSDQMEMDGKTYDYDEYQGKYEFEGYTEDEQVVMEEYVLIRRYVMNEKGELHALIELQEKIGENGKKNTPIYRRTEKITKFQEGQFPENVFKIPKDYEETAAFPEEDVIIEE